MLFFLSTQLVSAKPIIRIHNLFNVKVCNAFIFPFFSFSPPFSIYAFHQHASLSLTFSLFLSFSPCSPPPHQWFFIFILSVSETDNTKFCPVKFLYYLLGSGFSSWGFVPPFCNGRSICSVCSTADCTLSDLAMWISVLPSKETTLCV